MARLRHLDQDEHIETNDATALHSAASQHTTAGDSTEDTSKSRADSRQQQLQKARPAVDPVGNVLRTSKSSGNRQRTLNSRFGGFAGAYLRPNSSAPVANDREICPQSQLDYTAGRATPSRTARKNVSYKLESPEVSIVELVDSEWEGDDSEYSGGDGPSENLELDLGRLQLSPSVRRNVDEKPSNDDDSSSDDSSLAILRL